MGLARHARATPITIATTTSRSGQHAGLSTESLPYKSVRIPGEPVQRISDVEVQWQQLQVEESHSRAARGWWARQSSRVCFPTAVWEPFWPSAGGPWQCSTPG